MNWLLPAIIATLSASAILTAVFYYLYFQDREDFFVLWTIGWGVYTLRFVFQLWQVLSGGHTIAAVLVQYASLGSGILLLAGTFRFVGGKIAPAWLIGAAVAAIWIPAAVFLELDFVLTNLPTFSLLGLLYIRIGQLFFRRPAMPGWGIRVVGWAFIIWGIHKADYPFIRPIEWLAPWGYLFGSLLELIVAIGMLLVYFETTRQTLHQREQRLQAIIQDASYLNGSLEINEVLQRIAAGAHHILKAFGITIYLLDSEGNALLPQLAIDPDFEAEILNTPLQVEKSLTGQAILTGKALIYNQPLEQSTIAQIPGTPVDTEERLIVAPFVIDGRPVGALCIYRMGEPFTLEELELAETFANHATAALKNARIHRDLQNEMEERRRVAEALQESESHLSTLLSQTPVGIVTIDMRGLLTDINPRGLEILGSPGKSFTLNLNVLTLENLIISGFSESFRQVLEQGVSQTRSGWYTSTWGKRIYLRGTFVPRYDSTRRQIGAILLFDDDTVRQQAEAALQESETRYRSLFENNHSVMLIIEPVSGQIVDANEAACQYYGYSKSEILELDISQINILKQEPVFVEIGANRQGQRSYLLYTHRLSSGELREVEVYSGPIILQGRDLLYSIVHDVTERVRREREMQTIARLLTALRTADNQNEMLPIILQQVMDTLQASGASLAIYDPATQENVIRLGIGNAAFLSGRRLPLDQGVCGLVVSQKQSITFTELDIIPPKLRLDKRPDAPGCLAGAPLVAQEETIGALVVNRRHRFTETDLRLLTAIGEISANAIQRSTLFEETRRSLRRLDALHTIDRAITSRASQSEILQIILEQVTGQLGVDSAAVLLSANGPAGLGCIAHRGFSNSSTSEYTPGLSLGYAGQIFATARRLQVHDLGSVLATHELTITQAGLNGYKTYFGVPLLIQDHVRGVLELYSEQELKPDADWLSFLGTLAQQTAIAIDNTGLLNELQQSNYELRQAYDTTLAGWARALELRDKETKGHAERVLDMTVALAQRLGVHSADLIHLRRGALLHDIGKMGISDAILHKAGPLDDIEWEIMRQHPVLAYELLRDIDYLRPALDIPYYHHEKWDGSGYPQGLQGEQIPLAARIFAIIDVWDALRSDRPYRPAWSFEKTLSYIQEQSGRHFDPEVVGIFLEYIQNLAD